MFKVLLRGALGASFAVCAASAVAQTYPTKPVRIIVGFPPGGANDIIARLLAARFQERLGQSFVVENRPGANAIIGTDAVAKSAADGYTLLVGASGAMTFNPGLYPKLPYDPVRDFAPITMVGSFPVVIAVHPTVKANSVKELIDLARNPAAKLTYAAGSTPFHLAGELFKQQNRVALDHIPYKGSAAAVTAALSGETNMVFVDLPPIGPQIRAGKLRGLAVTSAKRMASLPDVPTAAEAGLPDFEVTLWTALFAPAGTPNAIVTKLRDEVAAYLREVDPREKLGALGIEPVAGTSAELARVMRVDLDRWTKVIREAGVKAD